MLAKASCRSLRISLYLCSWLAHNYINDSEIPKTEVNWRLNAVFTDGDKFARIHLFA